jgi:hypothetical protein
MISASRDRLTSDAPTGLSAEADHRLRVDGVPSEAVLDERVGPKVFSSELGDGSLHRLGVRWPGLATHRRAAHFVLGRISDSESELEYGAFVMEPGVARVILVDIEGGHESLVNSDLGAFLRCIDAFVAWWDDLIREPKSVGPDSAERLEREVEELAARLSEIDPESMRAPDSYWPLWLDDLRTF